MSQAEMVGRASATKELVLAHTPIYKARYNVADNHGSECGIDTDAEVLTEPCHDI